MSTRAALVINVLLFQKNFKGKIKFCSEDADTKMLMSRFLNGL